MKVNHFNLYPVKVPFEGIEINNSAYYPLHLSVISNFISIKKDYRHSLEKNTLYVNNKLYHL